MKQLKIIILLLFFCLLMIPKNVWAEESITLKSIIENISNKTDVNITYKIIPHAENEPGATNVPTQVIANFKDVEVDNYTLTKEVEIDFSNTEYLQAGTYKYGLAQKEIDNPNIVLSKAMYEIWVDVTLQDDGTLKKEVSPLVMDFEIYEKADCIEYRNTTNFTSIQIENRLDGNLKEYDKDVYFKYKISIQGPVGDTYQILGQDPTIIFDNQKIETKKEYIISNNTEENFVIVYLKDQQSLTIGYNEKGFREIPKGTHYTITKMGGEKWLTVMDDKERDSIELVTGEEDKTVIIVNKRDYDSAITGVFYITIPFMILWIIAISGMILFPRKKIEL